MERQQELRKLINVLRRTGRMALQAEWTGTSTPQDTAAFCTTQYNRVLVRLREIDAGVATVFDPLPAASSLAVVAMACRQVVAYFEDEFGPELFRGPRAAGIGFDGQAFKEFWRKSAHDIEDLGEFIRESVAEWVRQRKGGKPGCGPDAAAPQPDATGAQPEPPPQG